ncbi:polysaccharide deacetylase family protein [Eubacterium sp.]|uniref:polysaccharide deacetylase family protein n=1 Tax=Eubacterium sp. TaxID=142586 RepID=UPI00258B3BF5|nr:polysaccharide deacetylase family protein [Eubacterium sp.]MCR5367238.1 polysaccharide deacetylase family protein [Eubacterium sp.]
MSKLYISMYHYTRDLKHSRYPEIKGLDLPLFRQQLEYMKANFNVVTMEQVIDAVESKSELPEKALLLTFDDGYVDNYTFALPLLEEFGFQGSFFIPGKTFSTHKLLDVNKIHYILASANIYDLVEDVKKEMDKYRGSEFDFAPTDELFAKYATDERFDIKETVFVKRMLQTVLPEKLRNIISSNLFEKYVGVTEEQLAYELYMTEDQIRTMKSHGMFIGIHGYDHYWLANLPKEQMQKDIAMALDTLDEFIDRKHWVMNFPYGNYNRDVLDYISVEGACVGLTTEVRVADLSKDAVLTLPRLDCNDFPPKSYNYKNI